MFNIFGFLSWLDVGLGGLSISINLIHQLMMSYSVKRSASYKQEYVPVWGCAWKGGGSPCGTMKEMILFQYILCWKQEC